MDIHEATARAIAELTCNVVSIRVGSGLNLITSEALIAVTFGDHKSESLTIGLTDPQAIQLHQELTRALHGKVEHDEGRE